MLRIRVGLIIQVMASELARTLKCSGELLQNSYDLIFTSSVLRTFGKHYFQCKYAEWSRCWTVLLFCRWRCVRSAAESQSFRDENSPAPYIEWQRVWCFNRFGQLLFHYFVYFQFLESKVKKPDIAVCNKPHRYGNSRAISDHTVLPEVTFPPLPQPIKAGTWFSAPRGMQGWVDLVGLVTYRGGIPAQRRSPIPALTGSQQHMPGEDATRMLQGNWSQKIQSSQLL